MESLLVELEKVTQIVSRCRLYEIMYLDNARAAETEDTVQPAFVNLEAALVKLYTAILEVLAYAFNTFGKSLIKRTLSSTLYSDLDSQLSRLDRDVINCAHICENVHGRSSHKNAREILKILRDLEQPMQHIDLSVRLLLKSVGKARRTQILQWISPIPYEDDHNTACDGHTSGTGEWLLEHQTYSNWKTSKGGTILWLNGMREKPIPNLLCCVLMRQTKQLVLGRRSLFR